MKLRFLTILALLPLLTFGQQELRVEANVGEVTLFLNKAQVTRTLKHSIPAGQTDLVITGLTPQLDPQSIQVSGKGNLMILGTTHRINYLNEFATGKALKSLQDSAALCQKRIQAETAARTVVDREEQLLLANQKISGNNQNLTVTELRTMADFFRTRLTDLSSSRAKSDEQIRIWNEKLARINRQINEQNELQRRNTSEIVIKVQSEKGTSAQLDISYVVGNAGWTPVYDIRSSGTRDNLTLDYKANTWQSTGEDWENAQVTLSTANPNLDGLKPQLQPWVLDFVAPLREIAVMRKRTTTPMAMSQRADAAPADMQIDDATNLAEVVTIVETTLNVEFRIALPQTLRSSGKPVMVDIRKATVNAAYEYSVVPKLDKDAFLMARLTGWDALNLLPGEANIFFEGTFVGKTFIDPNTYRDTLSVSLGRDKRIVVSREKLKDLSSRKVIGTNQRESATWQISVRNTKSEPIRMVVEDQMPVSRNSQLEVLNTDAGGALIDAATGKLQWNLDIPAGETKKVTFRYEIKYPKDKVISGF